MCVYNESKGKNLHLHLQKIVIALFLASGMYVSSKVMCKVVAFTLTARKHGETDGLEIVQGDLATDFCIPKLPAFFIKPVQKE